MKIVSLKIENFRSYRNPTTITFNDLTVLIGKNDIGKSSILEALDIFFDNRKMESDDVNIIARGNGESAKISVVFSGIPAELDIDSGGKTNLHEEYLLDGDGNLQIKKDFSSISKPKTYILCNHPSNENANDLFYLTITQLQKRVKDLGVEGDFKANTKNEIRKAIWNSLGDTIELLPAELETGKDGVKDIWEKLTPHLPLYALFQADRKNDEKDKEIQDPLKVAAEQALKKHLVKLDEIKKEVEKEIEEIANLTIEKLKEMNAEVAEQLKPHFAPELKWADLFKPTLTSDDIPMNKRGSGVRRLLLINFFRAEAARKRKEKGVPNIIYAIEEPETSQHPDWQIKLMDALKTLANEEAAQIITTTHSPALAGLVEVENIRFIYKEMGENIIEIGTEENVQKIANTLGVLPNIPDELDKLKVIICLEGPTDIAFMFNICGHFGIDLKNDKRILTICMGGGTLAYWVTHNYLSKLNRPEIHIYDSDVKKYQKFIDMVNKRGNNSWGVLTMKREIENYVHPDIITSLLQLEKALHDTSISGWQSSWDVLDVEVELVKHKRNNIKGSISEHGASRMTIDLFKDLDAFDEVNKWFEEIKNRLN
ncbi:AAA15 family ATPase/GTPase [Algoriphagus iocasae]|uniref:AAA15 family ATPase/GTPase n=1 Tax=Algoriphagus iocasae TaxID=1836499 RepID=A0A841MPZ5_9BACT|nr:ATP-binding protein [Algoriphagus iocasae]MBB6327659.1 AAA15 family ATPase/GTPase [Algoriphagus iocasae]